MSHNKSAPLGDVQYSHTTPTAIYDFLLTAEGACGIEIANLGNAHLLLSRDKDSHPTPTVHAVLVCAAPDGADFLSAMRSFIALLDRELPGIGLKSSLEG